MRKQHTYKFTEYLKRKKPHQNDIKLQNKIKASIATRRNFAHNFKLNLDTAFSR